MPMEPVATAEEFPPRLITERTLCLIVESSSTFPCEDGGNALGLSSGLENPAGIVAVKLMYLTMEIAFVFNKSTVL